MHRTRTTVAWTALLVAITAAPATAHVTLDPSVVPKGSFANFEVRVPTERPDASTTKVELFFPEDSPLPFVNVMPHPGWEYTVERRQLDEPLEVFGQEFTEVVEKIVWEGGEIAPGEFDEMEISVGPIPDDVDRLVFRAIQTYDSGEEVRWAEVAEDGAEEPENPAPIVTLTDAVDEGGAASGGATEAAAGQAAPAAEMMTVSGTANAIDVTALVLAVLALALAVAAFVSVRRRHAAP